MENTLKPGDVIQCREGLDSSSTRSEHAEIQTSSVWKFSKKNGLGDILLVVDESFSMRPVERTENVGFNFPKIIQELEHKSKLPQSTSGTEISSGPKLNRVKKSGTKVDANSSKVAANAGTEVEDDRLMFVVAESQGSREETTDVSHLSPDKLEDIKRKEVRNDDSDSVAEKSSVKMEVQNVILDVHPHEDNARHSPMEDLTDSGALELRKEPSHDVETEESVKRNDDVDTSRKSSLWENLKSFADGIVNIWKKL
ncbi:uncharacterized protein LOC125316001 [Rhodamnia argentea]|uniref:Uncharacterized protein LOC125316001 n=1 Tax=Rhodamnia argentea TaxID=178133 RepID=A0ABM3HPT6_9MYRT|nr:uncharacterized protein LOC125316001 [Rhodamnia argentea]